MEEVLVNINYLIREKLWGSVKTLAEKVSDYILINSTQYPNLLSYLGVRQRPGCRSHFLESIRHFQRGKCHRSH